ncbi:MAG: hypothetical protein F4X43_06965, partial [Acidobacteria bacterium]|nr:hypothetical protein [Acidobacteriota bacterium]
PPPPPPPPPPAPPPPPPTSQPNPDEMTLASAWIVRTETARTPWNAGFSRHRAGARNFGDGAPVDRASRPD